MLDGGVLVQEDSGLPGDGASDVAETGPTVSKANPMGTLRGQVLDVVAQAPISGVDVSVPGGPATKTDAQGAFTLTVARGRVKLVMTHASYVARSVDTALGFDDLVTPFRMVRKASDESVSASATIVVYLVERSRGRASLLPGG